MRISTVENATPDSSPPVSKEKYGQYIWGDLAYRLIHPVRLAIIEALYQWEQPQTIEDLTLVTDEPEELIRYYCGALVKEGVLEPRTGGEGDDEIFFYFLPPPEQPLSSVTA